MTITLGESDSFLHGGKAEIIIVNVKLDNGKTVTFPFPAKNPIWKVYEAVSKISEEKIITPIAVREEVISRPESVVLGSTDSSSIGREDLVKCVKLYPRGEGATVDLKVGDIYRVLKIVKSGYEVIDDKAATPMRLFVFSDEVVFHQKRKPPLPKVEGKKGKSSWRKRRWRSSWAGTGERRPSARNADGNVRFMIVRRSEPGGTWTRCNSPR